MEKLKCKNCGGQIRLEQDALIIRDVFVKDVNGKSRYFVTKVAEVSILEERNICCGKCGLSSEGDYSLENILDGIDLKVEKFNDY